MVSALVTFAAVLTALLYLVGVAALVPVLLEIESPLWWLLVFWASVFAAALGCVRLATWFAHYPTARALVRLGAVGAVVIFTSGLLVVLTEAWGLPMWLAAPPSVAFAALLMAWDSEIRQLLTGRAGEVAPRRSDLPERPAPPQPPRRQHSRPD